MPSRVRQLTVTAAALSTVVSTPPLGGQDTVRTHGGAPILEPQPLFTARDAIGGALFVGATVVLVQYDRDIAEYLRSPARQEPGTMNDFLTGIEPLNEHKFFFGSLGAWAVGRIAGWESLADIGLHTAEANIIATTMTSVVRHFAGRSRPSETNNTESFDFEWRRGDEGGQFRSFPSLHATGAFAFAAATTKEVGLRWPEAIWYVGPPLYLTATIVGLGRMYTNKHWASDVLAAGAIGTFVGLKMVRFHHSHPSNEWDRWLLRVEGSRSGAVLIGFERRTGP